MKPFLQAVRSQVIPPALIPFLYDIKPPVSFVDGCLVVEIQDLRRNPEVKSRVVMRPAAEALAQTIDVMLDRRGQAGDERLALELESRIIVSLSRELLLIFFIPLSLMIFISSAVNRHHTISHLGTLCGT